MLEEEEIGSFANDNTMAILSITFYDFLWVLDRLGFHSWLVMYVQYIYAPLYHPKAWRYPRASMIVVWGTTTLFNSTPNVVQNISSTFFTISPNCVEKEWKKVCLVR